MRSAKSVPHCDSALTASSDGRWVMRPSETPYFRPSLAIRAMARAVAAKPAPASAGT